MDTWANGRIKHIGPVQAGGNCPPGRVSFPTLDDLLRTPPESLSRLDVGLRNLLCATGLPGAEDLDIPEYMRRLEALTERARRKIQRDLPRFREDPAQFKFPGPCTENFFRIINLVTSLKIDCCLHGNPERVGDRGADIPYTSRDLLINGLLSDQRTGTCNSMPVVVVAVGRRLGYPLYLSFNPFHVWARWDGDGERFNIDPSCLGGFDDHGDDYYLTHPRPMPQVSIESGYYLRSMTPADETAMFLFSRGWVLEDHKRFEDSLPAWAKCCFLAPSEPMYPRRAYEVAFEAVHVRKFGKPSQRSSDGRPLTGPGVGDDLRKLLPPRELATYLSITAHFHEVRGEVNDAIKAYRLACQVDPRNPDYESDRRRYLKRLSQDTTRDLRPQECSNQQPTAHSIPSVLSLSLPPLEPSSIWLSGSLLPPITTTEHKESNHV